MEDQGTNFFACRGGAAGKPLKTVLNLSTALDTLSFNHDSQMMVMASRLKRDALRWGTVVGPVRRLHGARVRECASCCVWSLIHLCYLTRRVVHVPTMTVFSNWPTSKSPLHYVHSTAFSPHSGYLAIGNARGRVLLYRLHHYSKA